MAGDRLWRRARSPTSSFATGSAGTQRSSPARPAPEDSPHDRDGDALQHRCLRDVEAHAAQQEARLDPTVPTELEHGVVVAGIGLARLEQAGLVGEVLHAGCRSQLVQEPRRGLVARAGPVGDHDAAALAGAEARDAAPQLVGRR